MTLEIASAANEAVREFLRGLEQIPNLKVQVDQPDDPQGEWWFDLSYETEEPLKLEVVWTPVSGFGVFTAPGVYGARPSEIYRRPEIAVKRIEQLTEQ